MLLSTYICLMSVALSLGLSQRRGRGRECVHRGNQVLVGKGDVTSHCSQSHVRKGCPVLSSTDVSSLKMKISRTISLWNATFLCLCCFNISFLNPQWLVTMACSSHLLKSRSSWDSSSSLHYFFALAQQWSAGHPGLWERNSSNSLSRL